MMNRLALVPSRARWLLVGAPLVLSLAACGGGGGGSGPGPTTYTIGGTLSGLLAGQQITLIDNGNDPLTLKANGSFTFAKRVAPKGSYAVTIGTQPTLQTCSISKGSGSGVTANVTSVAVSCTNGNLYSSSFGAGGGVWQYAINPTSGALAPLSPASVPAGSGNGGIALDKTGRYLYVPSQGNSAIYQFSRGVGGALTPLPRASLPGQVVSPTSLTVSADGKYLYATNTSSTVGNVGVFGIDPNGQISPAGSGIASIGNPINPIVASPTGPYLYGAVYAGRLGQNTIGANGDPIPMSPASVLVPTTQANRIAIAPNGKSVYIGSTLNGTISQLALGANGLGSLLSPSSVTAGTAVNGMAIDPGSNYLYVSGSHFVYQYNISNNGELVPMDPASVPVAAASVPASSLTGIQVDPTGRYVYVSADQPTSQTYGFSIGANGTLTPLSAAPVPAGTSSVSMAVR
jgi:6-phosphogluconolactonase (cycloisomerase 2 family)